MSRIVLPSDRLRQLPDISADKLIAIGRIVAAWAEFESRMDMYLHVFLKQPETQHLAEDLRPAFKERVRFWRDAVELLHTEPVERAAVDSIIERAVRLFDERNWATHGLFREGENEVEQDIQIRLRTSIEQLRFTQRTIHEDRINRAADEIWQLGFDLVFFFQDFIMSREAGDTSVWAKGWQD